MTEHDNDRELREKIARACLPPELLSGKPEDLDALLECTDAEPLSDEEVERILKKAKGQLPLGPAAEDEYLPFEESELITENQELLALHRSQGQSVPKEVEKKLEEYRKRARRSKGDISE
jgi:hypothetical protein